ncbi:PEP-CTERM sorting domain-containing protein [Paucibacter sp. R3-3]|uniref:PEP-CTERM sorting domain-containing protein n=1 Tax=Roseateles agri TaxID=3098619 RepID=A0ABU5DSD8_9BURK|nr:PEP-CTERM sorting domain-containing protein [Paucibacter sp. R3-3]MDY0748199.1 PEP-CTERM sorting domain-containing protein [Paucibacter sp. R3-3]
MKRRAGTLARFTLAAGVISTCGSARSNTVDWQGGSGDWNDLAHWSSAALPDVETDVRIVSGASSAPTTVTVSDCCMGVRTLVLGAYNRLELNAEMAPFVMGGSIVNDGDIYVRATRSSGEFAFATDTVLYGSGTVWLTSNLAGISLTSGTLTIGLGQTIRGSGVIGAGNVVNRGNILAEGFMTLAAGNGGRFDNSGGTITIGANSYLTVNPRPVSGGRIVGGAGSTIRSGEVSDVAFSGDVSLNSMRVVSGSNSGTLRVSAGGAASLEGSFENNGDIRIGSRDSYYSSVLGLDGDFTLSGTGTVWLLRGPLGNVGGLQADQLVVLAGQTIRGAGSFVVNSFVNHGRFIVEGGLLTMGLPTSGNMENQGGTITIAHDGQWALSGGGLVLDEASTLTFDIGSGQADHGQLVVGAGAPLRLDGTLMLNIGYGAGVGDSFNLLSGTLSGTFDQVLTTGYALTTAYSADGVTVIVAGISPVPEPSTWVLLLTGAAVLLARRCQRRVRQW